MRLKVLVVFVFIVSFYFENIAWAADQQIVFCANNFKYSDYLGSVCKEKCQKYADCGLDSLLSNGWLIVSSSPKEIVAQSWDYNWGCTCIGTEYVLQKEDKSTMVNSQISDKEVDLLKKENELLKKEIEMLKQENEKLNGKLKTKQK